MPTRPNWRKDSEVREPTNDPADVVDVARALPGTVSAVLAARVKD
jgi:hypothetical protein